MGRFDFEILVSRMSFTWKQFITTFESAVHLPGNVVSIHDLVEGLAKLELELTMERLEALITICQQADTTGPNELLRQFQFEHMVKFLIELKRADCRGVREVARAYMSHW